MAVIGNQGKECWANPTVPRGRSLPGASFNFSYSIKLVKHLLKCCWRNKMIESISVTNAAKKPMVPWEGVTGGGVELAVSEHR